MNLFQEIDDFDNNIDDDTPNFVPCPSYTPNPSYTLPESFCDDIKSNVNNFKNIIYDFINNIYEIKNKKISIPEIEKININIDDIDDLNIDIDEYEYVDTKLYNSLNNQKIKNFLNENSDFFEYFKNKLFLINKI